MSDKPKIFISSTIFDFKDLRSSLKFYLESLGFQVFMSEFNDFKKKLDENSYNACLQTIRECDYFILLVGSRIGGYYNLADKISITQKEYETAYEKLKHKKLKILTFVRKEIWIIKEDRKMLEKVLKSDYKNKYEIEDEDIQKIKNFNSEIVNNAEFIFSFLNEVGKINEMKEAISGESEFPKGNWIHPFNDFSDIINVLKTEFLFKEDLGNVAMLENLRYECINNLKQFLLKNQNINLKRKHSLAKNARLQFHGNIKEESEIVGDDLASLGLFILIGCGLSENLSLEFLEQILYSGKFLDFDKDSGVFKQSLLTNALLNLKERISSLIILEEKLMNLEKRIKVSENYVKHIGENETISIKNFDLIVPMIFHDLHEDIVNLLGGVIKYIDGDISFLKNLKLNEKSPIKEYNKDLKSENPNDDDIHSYVISQFYLEY